MKVPNSTGKASKFRIYLLSDLPQKYVTPPYAIKQDKQSKISWLNKLIECLESVTSESITADPNKIVAGIEPEFTNQMLQTFGSIAIDVANGELTMSQILENMSSETNTAGQPTDDGPHGENRENQHNQQNEEVHSNQTNNARQQEQPTTTPQDTHESNHRERPHSQRNSQKNSQKASPSKPPTKNEPNEPSEDKEQWLLDTQRTLGALIQRPRLLDKLLRRPPFRFLFDIVQSLIKSTGFPLQFLDETTDITNADMKDLKFKFYFLSKLIVIASAATNEDLSSIDPKQIIAGRNPEGTNILLTRLAEAATSDLDVDAIKKRMVTISQQQKEKVKKQKKQKEKVEPKKEPKRESNQSAKSRSTHRESSGGTNTARKNAPIMPKLELEQLQKPQNKPMSSKPPKPSNSTKPVKSGPVRPTPVNMPETDTSVQPPPFQAIQKLQRPRTARRAPPKLQSNVVEEEKGSELKNAVIIMDDTVNGGNEDNEDVDADLEQTKETKEDSDLQRLGFIDPHDLDRERSERVQGVEALENAADGDHGKLVRDILDAQSGIKIDNMKLGTHRKDSAKSVERMENMKEMIQTLCQTCLPLGKCIDLVFQDVEAINTEMMKWKQQIATNQAKLTQEKEQTANLLAPLHRKLKDIERQIKQQNQMILEKKAVLLRNEEKTSEIIRKRLLNE